MRTTLTLNAAPPALSPGGYVARAYADHVNPATAEVELVVSERGGVWDVALMWRTDAPVTKLAGDPTVFVDAAALLVPTTEAAQALTMGAPSDPVEGVLWRADRERPIRIVARGWGTVERHDAPPEWRIEARWQKGVWRLRYTLAGWSALDRFRRLAVAVWQGARQERAGLKSVSAGWVSVS